VPVRRAVTSAISGITYPYRIQRRIIQETSEGAAGGFGGAYCIFIHYILLSVLKIELIDIQVYRLRTAFDNAQIQLRG